MKEVLTTVTGATYMDDIDGIAVLLSDEEGNEYKHIMYSSEFSFTKDMDRAVEMIRLAKLMQGKPVKYCYDGNIEKQKTKPLLQ